MFEAPQRVWDEVRAQGGVAYRDEIQAWVVVDYAMVQSGLRDSRPSNQVAGSGPASGPLAPLIEVLRDQLFLMDLQGIGACASLWPRHSRHALLLHLSLTRDRIVNVCSILLRTILSPNSPTLILST